MACRGVHFALTDEQADALRRAAGDDGRLIEVLEEIEDAWDRDWLVESDKAWDAIHRCLTGGALEYGDAPEHKCILGARSLHEGDGWIVNLLGPGEVRGVAAAIGSIDEAELCRRYVALDPGDYDGPIGEDDFGYTWENFAEVRDFFRKAADAGRSVVFTVSQ